ncbi:MAG TPA: DUF433 domain-containing protein [Chloroflexia bacterium]
MVESREAKNRQSASEVYVVLDTQQLSGLITCDPEIVSGTPVFAGTRVPIKNLFDYLEGGHDLQEFFEDFPSVGEEQVRGVLELAKDSLLALLPRK